MRGYEEARDDVAVRETSHEAVAVAGDDAPGLLDRTLSRRTSDLQPGESSTALHLSPEGRTLHMVRVLRRADDHVLVGETARSLAESLEEGVFVEDVEFKDTDLVLLELRGPDADDHVPGDVDLLDTPMEGADVLVPPDVDVEAPALSADAAEALRVEAGVPGEADLRGRLPLAAAEDAVDYSRCYPGQEVVARVAQRGRGPRERFVCLRSDDSVAEAEGVDVTSTARSPRHGYVALGYVDDETDDADLDVEVHEPPLDPGVRA